MRALATQGDSRLAAGRLAAAMLLPAWLMAVPDASAYSAQPQLLGGRTLRDSGVGCSSCHAQDSGLTVTITGPSTLRVREDGLYTLTATKAGVGSGVKLGMAAAASDGVMSSFLYQFTINGEIIHFAQGGTGGSLPLTNAGGTAVYYFYYRTDTTAQGGSQHTISALARLGGAHGWNHAANFVVTATPNVPQPPSFTGVQAGNGQATLHFQPTTDGGAPITAYTITATPGGATFTGAASPIVATGLTNGTPYTFRVTATNSEGTSLQSSSSSSVTPGAPPGEPLNPVATAGNASASVAFSPPASSGTSFVSGYTVTASPGGATGTGPSSPVVVPGLTNGTPYSFTVTASSYYGAGPPSVPSNTVTPQPIPAAPPNLSAVAGNGNVILSFDAADDGGSPITSYVVTVTPGAGTDSGAGTTARSRRISGLANGTQYQFSVRAVNAFGSGPPSNTAFATPYTVPGAATNVAATAGNASALVTFGPAPANGASVSGYTVVSNPPGGVDANAGSTLSPHAIQGLTNGVSYTFTVVATNAAGNGPPSAPSNAVVPSAANAPRVVWTRTLARTPGEPSYCHTPISRRGPALDASGNVFVNGCALTSDGNYDVVTHKLAAATGNVLWTANHTNFPVAGSYPLAYALVPSDAGHVVLATTTRNPATFDDTLRLVKYNGATGAVIWTAGDPSASGDDSATDITADAAGNVVVTTNGGGLRTVKFSAASGAKLWHQTTFDYAAGVAVDAQGHVATAGSVVQNNRDFQVARYHGATGAPLWTASWSATPTGNYEQARTVATDGSGNVFVAGLSLPGVALVKFDAATGAVLWATPSAISEWQVLAVDGAGDVFAAGTSNDAMGGYNIRTAKFSGATGALVWDRTFNGSGNASDFGSSIALDQQGNVIVAGQSEETGASANIRAIKYRGSDGALLWTHHYQASLRDEGLLVAVGPDNAAVITGRLQVDADEYALLVQKLADPAPPGPPQNPMATAQPGSVAVSFSPPADDGGNTIVGYTATCGARSATGAASPVTVTGLAPGVPVNCSVVATNSSGSGPASAVVSATPLAVTTALVSVASRKSHAGVPFDLPLATGVPVTGAVTVEPRAAAGGHVVVFTFNEAITSAGSAAVADAAGAPLGAATASANGNDVIVALPALANAMRVTVSLSGVNGGAAASVSVGFLLGDVNGSRAIDGADAMAVRAHAGQAVTPDNFHVDVNLSGMVGAADVIGVKRRAGQGLP